MKTKNIIFFLIKLLLSIGCIAYVTAKVPLSDVRRILENTNLPWMACAFALFVISKIASAYRLHYYFSAAGVKISRESNLKLYWLGMFYNQFLPGGIGGDVIKTYKINKALGKSVGQTAKLIFFDRLSGLSVLIVLTVGTTALLLPQLWIFPILLMSACIYCLLFVLQKQVGVVKDPQIKSELYSWLVQISQFCSAFCLLKCIGFEGLYLPYLVIFLTSSILSVVPLTLGGIGIRELTFTVGAVWLHLDQEIAVSIGLLFYLLSLAASLGGLWYVIYPPELRATNVKNYPYLTKISG